MKAVKFTRQELYDLVWRESLPSLSKKYDITYNDLRKTCVAMEIPLPKAGYWQNLWLGKEVSIEPLPETSTGQQETTLNLLEEGDERTPKLKAVAKVLQEKIEKETELDVTVSARLTNPDKLIVAAKKNMTGTGWKYGREAGMVSSSRDILDITVSPGNVARALRFMDALIKSLQTKGNNVIIENGISYAVVEGEKVKIWIREKTKRTVVKNSYGRDESEYHPIGILAFRMEIFHKSSEWIDGTLLIEDQLSNILAKIEIKAREYKAEMLVWKKHREEREEEMRLIREQEQRKAQELADFKELMNEAHEWHKVTLLRQYIDKVEAKALADNKVNETLEKWLAWARKKADAFDPLNNPYKSYEG